MTLNPALLTGTAPVAFYSRAGGFSPMLRGPMVPLSPDGDAGALSMAEGVSLLTALGDEEDVDDEAAPKGEGDPEDTDEATDDQTAAGDDAPDEDDPASEDDPEDDEGDDGEPATAIAAPEFWSADDKATFAKAPPEVQKVIAERFKEAETRVYAAKEEAAGYRQEASTISQAREKIDQLIGRASQIFQGKWDGVDWAQWAKDAPDEAFAAKMEFDAEQEELGRLQTAQAATADEEQRQFERTEAAKLAELVPELADPKVGQARKGQLVDYLLSSGFQTTDIRVAGAAELTLAYKAMKYDQAQAALARKPKTPAPAAPQPKSVRPTGAAPPRKSKLHRRTADAVSRVMKTGRMDDAVAALRALGE